jgi:hypothetical protein
MSQHIYAEIVGRALGQTGAGPYRFGDLLEAFDVITDEFCGRFDPGCSRMNVLDWLLSEGPQGQERLLREFNTRRAPGSVIDEAPAETENLCWWAR